MTSKTILITGATGALGFATASYVYEQGYHIVVVGRNLEKLQSMYADFSNDRCIIIENSLTTEEAIKTLFKTIKEIIGPAKLGALINCSGAVSEKPIHMVKEKDIMAIFQINTFSPILLVKYFAKKNNHQMNSSIVFISSLVPYNGAKGLAIYASSKGALDSMLMPLSAEFQGDIRINSIVSGTINDGMAKNSIDNLTEERRIQLDKDYLLGLGTSKDIAHMAEYLVSEKSRWITGQKFFLDGGYLSR